MKFFGQALRGALLTVAACAGLLLMPAAGPARAQEQRVVKLRVGDTVSFAHLGLYVGLQKGFFRAHGIEIERVMMPGGAKVLTTLLTGDIDIGFLSAITTLQSQFQSRPIKIIGASHAMEIYTLVGRNDVKIGGPADLKDHTIGISSMGSGSWAFANLMAHVGSLDPVRDIKIVPLGTMTALISGLKSKSVDTVALWEPGTTTALNEGLGYPIVDLLDPVQHQRLTSAAESVVEVIAAKEDVINGHADALKRFFAAQNEAYAWIHSAPIEELARTVAPVMEEGNMAVLQAALKRMLPGVPKTTVIQQATFDSSMKRMVDTGLFKETMPFARAVDNRFGSAQ